MESPSLTPTFTRIVVDESVVTFEPVSPESLYSNGRGFVRKAMVSNSQIYTSKDGAFCDSEFQIEQGPEYRLVRFFNIYKEEMQVFPAEEVSSSPITPQDSYFSFLAQSGLVGYDYLRTLVITQKVNTHGHYEYFVKRAGRYYLEQCDDTFPVCRKTWRPLYGLDPRHPWQLVLFKAWIKQCGGFAAMLKAEPFEFLQAFGLPAYKTYNFRKQLKFIESETLPHSEKTRKIKSFALNKDNVVIIAKTIQDKAVQSMGLVPDQAAYRLMRVSQDGGEPLYRIFSSLPCSWSGNYSPISNGEFSKVCRPQLWLDLDRNFLITHREIVTYFNKFYVSPFDLCESFRLVSQDCLTVRLEKSKPLFISFEVLSQQGMLAISIVFPDKQQPPLFRYFISKLVQPQQDENNQAVSALGYNSCDKWKCEYADFSKGYHRSGCTYLRAKQGIYVLYLDAEWSGQANIRFDSHVYMKKPFVYNPAEEGAVEILNSTLYDLSNSMGIEAVIKKGSSKQSVLISNAFDEVGFGSIVVKTEPTSRNQIAIKVHPRQFEAAGYRLLPFYAQLLQTGSDSFILTSARGIPEILLLERADRTGQEPLGVEFPPRGAVEFFAVQPSR